jgi:hypothetical protein
MRKTADGICNSDRKSDVCMAGVKLTVREGEGKYGCKQRNSFSTS